MKRRELLARTRRSPIDSQSWNVCSRLRIQPIDAADWLNRSAGYRVSDATVNAGLLRAVARTTGKRKFPGPPRTAGVGRVPPSIVRRRSYRHRPLLCTYRTFAPRPTADALTAGLQLRPPRSARPGPSGDIRAVRKRPLNTRSQRRACTTRAKHNDADRRVGRCCWRSSRSRG